MVFFDTNILLYASLNTDAVKHLKAATIIRDAIETGEGAISAQVLNEYCNVLFKKTRRSASEIKTLIEIFKPMLRVDTTSALIDNAIEIKVHYGLQYYDSLIIAAAMSCGCNMIYTEDMNDGQSYDGVMCVNPFKHP